MALTGRCLETGAYLGGRMHGPTPPTGIESRFPSCCNFSVAACCRIWSTKTRMLHLVRKNLKEMIESTDDVVIDGHCSTAFDVLDPAPPAFGRISSAGPPSLVVFVVSGDEPSSSQTCVYGSMHRHGSPPLLGSCVHSGRACRCVPISSTWIRALAWSWARVVTHGAARCSSGLSLRCTLSFRWGRRSCCGWGSHTSLPSCSSRCSDPLLYGTIFRPLLSHCWMAPPVVVNPCPPDAELAFWCPAWLHKKWLNTIQTPFTRV